MSDGSHGRSPSAPVSTPAPRPVGAGDGAMRALIGLTLLVAGGGLIFLVRGLLVPLVFGVLTAYALEPLIAPLVERGLRRGLAAGGLFALTLVLAARLLPALSPISNADVAEILRQLPELGTRIETSAAENLDELHRAQPWSKKLLPRPADGWTERLLAQQKEHLGGLVGHAGALFFLALLVPVVAFFLLRDGRRFLERMIALLPAREIETSVAIWCEIYGTLGRYLRGVALESAAIGTLAGAGLAFLGVPSALALGVFTALVNPVPYLGALTSFSVASLVALAYQLGFSKVVEIALLYLAIRVLDDFVVLPFTVGGSVHLHPFVVLLSILAGNELLGLVGMVIAVPIATVVQEVARILFVRRTQETGEGPELRLDHVVC